MGKVFSKSELYTGNAQRSYDHNCPEVAFLLGGIGTGNFSVGSRGQLKDWEIFGTSGKGNYLPNTFFAIWTKEHGKPPKAKVLEARLNPPFSKSHGFVDREIGGLPRFERSTARGEYPFFRVELEDGSMPVRVVMESFTPFIPLNADDSGIPTAVIRYKVVNTTDQGIDVSVAGSLANMSVLKKYDRHTWGSFQVADEGVNEYKDDGTIRGLFYHPKKIDDSSLYYGTMSLTTVSGNVTHKRAWLNGGWWDGLQDLWNDFKDDGRLIPESVYIEKDATNYEGNLTGSLAIYELLEPGEEKTFEFQISWHFPNRVNSWSLGMYDKVVRPTAQGNAEAQKLASGCSSDKSCCTPESGEGYPLVRKYYAKLFKDAWDAASYTAINMVRLEGDSRKFHDAFYNTTLPGYVLEAVANNITVIRSNTCLRLYDGRFLAWEGCFNDDGCCEGTCTHVWNYAQTVAFLFPELEQSMRRIEYQTETKPDGKMNFRTYQVWGMEGHDHVPAADGQLGTIVRLYREWRFSGDNDFLRELWPSAKKTLDYAFAYWDKDGDFVLDTNQFNTYDIAFQGPSSMINSIFYAALKAGAEISTFLHDEESAEKYSRAFIAGSARMDELLWGKDYYTQKVGKIDEYRYQYGNGCLADQIFGQTLAHITGLGYVLPEEHVKKTVESIFRNNYFETFENHDNPQRTYALNDEKGLVLCTWPDGGRPRLPFPYSDEVWTGIEYQVATNLIYEGFLKEGLTLVRSVRDRHDGVKRNPWNEVECGHHYARSLASYGVFIALCGYRYDLPNGRISFEPRMNSGNFQSFFSTGKCWGIYTQTIDGNGTCSRDIRVLYGSSDGVELDVV